MRDDWPIRWQDRQWQLRIARVQLPDGTQREQGFINHPGSVVIVPMAGDRVLMLRQYRLALEETILELPAGTRDWRESWESCAQRELREETGFRAASWTPLGQVWPGPGITNEIMALYLATDLTEDPLPPDADEEIEVAPYPLDALVRMAIDGRLQDAKSIIGLLRTAAYLGRLPG